MLYSEVVHCKWVEPATHKPTGQSTPQLNPNLAAYQLSPAMYAPVNFNGKSRYGSRQLVLIY